MELAVLAITNSDRLLAGLIALLLCLLALILWLFPVILLGRLWRHMTRPQRTRGMRAMIACMFLLTAALLVGVPHMSSDSHKTLVADEDVFIDTHHLGVTSWFARRIEDRTCAPSIYRGPTPLPKIVETSSVNFIGMLAILPALAAMWLIATWLWREMPGFYRRPDGRCDVCDYDLHGSRSPMCPECGETVA